jgi:hypothetical protein
MVMRLRNPGAGAIDAAAETLMQLKYGCENCRSAITFDEGKNAYLSWVEQAYAQLRSLFVDGGFADGLHSRFFWEIRRMDNTSPRPFELLNREVQTQSDRLQAIRDRLLGYKEFASRAGHIAIPDTSALVEGVWFEDFDWPAALGLTSTVRIVVLILVVEELDKLKDSVRTSKAGDRARRVLRRLRALCGAVPPGHPAHLPTRTNVTIEVLIDDDWHQRRPNNDGEIIDQALLVKAVTGQDVTLVCVDAAMEFRARQHGVTVLAMPIPDNAAPRRSEGEAMPSP